MTSHCIRLDERRRCPRCACVLGHRGDHHDQHGRPMRDRPETPEHVHTQQEEQA